MLKNEKPAFVLPDGMTDADLLALVVNHLADREHRMQQADVDLVSPVVDALARRVTPEVRQAAAETLRANGTIPVSLIASLSLPRRPRKAIADAVIYTPEQLVAMACQDAVSEAQSNLIVARGVMAAMVALVANPGASLTKSSLTTLTELAASDLSLREALCSRSDLPDSILDRLWPYLSLRAKAGVIGIGLELDRAGADALIAAAELDLMATMQQGDLPLGLSTCQVQIEAGELSIADAVLALGKEGRVADVACLLAHHADIDAHLALALLLGCYDRGCIILTKLAGVDEAGMQGVMDVRLRAGARRTADRRGPVHAFAALDGGEARQIVAALRLPAPVSAPGTAAVPSVPPESPVDVRTDLAA